MDSFALIVFGSFIVILLVFLGLGWAWRDRPLAEITDKEANEKWAAQLEIEQQEVPQMVDAANDYRRKRGLPEVTADEYRAKIGDEQAAILDQANKQLRARATRADTRSEGRGF